VSRTTERRLPAGRRGFTLLEVIVVLAVMATLISIVAPMVFRNVADSRVNAARSQLNVFILGLESYYADAGSYPSTEQGLAALREPPSGRPAPRRWRGPYLRQAVPRDPWGRPYIYVSPGVNDPLTFDLYSLGRDGEPGGSGEDADITSWLGPDDL
jgi:general secretion pathway protein G